MMYYTIVHTVPFKSLILCSTLVFLLLLHTWIFKSRAHEYFMFNKVTKTIIIDLQIRPKEETDV